MDEKILKAAFYVWELLKALILTVVYGTFEISIRLGILKIQPSSVSNFQFLKILAIT